MKLQLIKILLIGFVLSCALSIANANQNNNTTNNNNAVTAESTNTTNTTNLPAVVVNPTKLITNGLSNTANNQSVSAVSGSSGVIFSLINNTFVHVGSTFSSFIAYLSSLKINDVMLVALWLLISFAIIVALWFVNFIINKATAKLYKQYLQYRASVTYIISFYFALLVHAVVLIVSSMVMLQIVYWLNFTYYIHSILQIVILYNVLLVLNRYLQLLNIGSIGNYLITINTYISKLFVLFFSFFAVYYVLNQNIFYNNAIINVYLALFLLTFLLYVQKVLHRFKLNAEYTKVLVDYFINNKLYFMLYTTLIVVAFSATYLYLEKLAGGKLFALLIKIALLVFVVYGVNNFIINIFNKKIVSKINNVFNNVVLRYSDISKYSYVFNFSNLWLKLIATYKIFIYYLIASVIVGYMFSVNIYSYLAWQIAFKVLSIALFAYVATAVVVWLVQHKIESLSAENNLQSIKRLVSAMVLCGKPYKILVYVISFIFLLSAFNISILALLAGTSVITFALAFGARDILQNFFNSILFLLEGSFFVGDLVEIAGKLGVVEDISLLYVKIRDTEGKIQMVPFSKIDIITNYNKDFSYCLINCGVAYGSNVATVYNCLKDITTTLRTNPKYATDILDDVEILGVTSLNDFSINVRARVKTTAGMQFAINRAYLEEIHSQFPKYGIDIPFPIQTLHIKK